MRYTYWKHSQYALVQYEQLSDAQKKALESAFGVLNNAYNPYSHFAVGATLVTDAGEFISGVNVENAAFGSTICAERSALMHAYSKDRRKFSSLALIARGEKFDTEVPTAPCGACRQMLFEAAQVSGVDLELILSTTRKNKIIITTIQALLPMAFGPLDLGVDLKKWQ